MNDQNGVSDQRREMRFGPAICTRSAATAIESLKGVYRRLFRLNFGVVERGRLPLGQPWGEPLSPHEDLSARIDPGSRGGFRDLCLVIAEFRFSGGRKLGYFRFPISFGRRPVGEELLALITLFENCGYPLLIHCLSVADRTGLASGLYLMAIRGKTPERAFGQAFSPRFGHLPVFGAGHLHEPFREYASWLREHQ